MHRVNCSWSPCLAILLACNPGGDGASQTDGGTGESGGSSSAVSGSSGNVPTSGGGPTEGSEGSGEASSASASSSGMGETTEPDETTTGSVCPTAGPFTASKLWVSSVSDGALVKYDTDSLIEEARYYTDPLEDMDGSNPSRVAVDIDGRYAVVTNRDAGTATMIAADLADCIDRNDNGKIETSMAGDQYFPFGEDECMVWHTPINEPFTDSAGLFATAWSPGVWDPQTCRHEGAKVWIGWLAEEHKAALSRVDGVTGAVDSVVYIEDWPITMIQYYGYSPHSAAVDAAGDVWTVPLVSDLLYRVDGETLAVEVFKSPVADSRHFGMAIDGAGRVWLPSFGGHGGVTVFDPEDASWTEIVGMPVGEWRAVAIHPNGTAWVSAETPCSLVEVDVATLSFVASHSYANCVYPRGVSVDVQGRVWTVSYGSGVSRWDPLAGDDLWVEMFGGHESYGDMTGRGLYHVVYPDG